MPVVAALASRVFRQDHVPRSSSSKSPITAPGQEGEPVDLKVVPLAAPGIVPTDVEPFLLALPSQPLPLARQRRDADFSLAETGEQHLTTKQTNKGNHAKATKQMQPFILPAAPDISPPPLRPPLTLPTTRAVGHGLCYRRVRQRRCAKFQPHPQRRCGYG